MNHRQQLSAGSFAAAMRAVQDKLEYRIKQKGFGTMASNHEILGVLVEELDEFREEVHRKGTSEAKVEELLDIAVGAVFGIASITSEGTDW